jgi:hypothetical protein
MQKEVVAHAADRAILLCIALVIIAEGMSRSANTAVRAGWDDSKPALIRHPDAGRYAHAALPSGRRCAF